MVLAKKLLSTSEIEQAIELRMQGNGIETISRRLQCGRAALSRLFKERGIVAPRNIHSSHHKPRDGFSDKDIGEIPKGHPLYEIDQQILRARNTRPQAEGGWRGSSIDWD